MNRVCSPVALHYTTALKKHVKATFVYLRLDVYALMMDPKRMSFTVLPRIPPLGNTASIFQHWHLLLSKKLLELFNCEIRRVFPVYILLNVSYDRHMRVCNRFGRIPGIFSAVTY